jgi:hypothetical protein
MYNKTQLHRVSGIILAVFVSLHLANHLAVLISPEVHLKVMDALRLFYRNVVVETLVLLAVLTQIITGIKLASTKGTKQKGWTKWQIWSGLYMAFFFAMHVSAVMIGRFLLKLDTDLYFGAAGLNVFPFNLFFVPYYSLAILAFFTHIASIHAQKSTHQNADSQAKIILVAGAICTVLILLGMTNFLQGLTIPALYKF